MSNIYYDPEDFGVALVKSHDVGGGYEFDTVAVFEQGGLGSSPKYFVAHDHGCSCPLPFDEIKLPDLTPVRSLADVAAFARESWADLDECEAAVAALLDGLTLKGTTQS